MLSWNVVSLEKKKLGMDLQSKVCPRKKYPYPPLLPFEGTDL